MAATDTRSPSIGYSKEKCFLWLLAALLSFGSAYSILRFFELARVVGDWLGLPQYATQIPILQREGTWYEAFSVVLPLIATVVLVFATAPRSDAAMGEVKGIISYPTETVSELWSTAAIRYVLCLGISIVATVIFFWLLILIGLVLIKLKIHAPV